ncbi:MAG: hypothetical protein WCJ02_13400 [bacterium]
MGQEEFNFTPSDKEEVDPLQADWDAMEDRASKVWTVPLRKKVRFKLEGMRDELEGVIRLARRPMVWESRQKLELRMKDETFTNHEIEQCTVIG